MRTWLIEARKAAGLTTTQLAFHAGVSEQSVDSWENGRRTPIRRKQFLISEILGNAEIPDLFDAEIKTAVA